MIKAPKKQNSKNKRKTSNSEVFEWNLDKNVVIEINYFTLEFYCTVICCTFRTFIIYISLIILIDFPGGICTMFD